jgi:hypothetical protein
MITEEIEQGLTPRQYAEREGITLQTTYQRIWQRKVEAQKVLDRWIITRAEEVGK